MKRFFGGGRSVIIRVEYRCGFWEERGDNMVKKCRAIKIGEHGHLTDSSDEAIVCPLRGAQCMLRCAWLSADGRVLSCKDTIIGALKGQPAKSFRLHSGPEVHNVDESLTEYTLGD